MKIARICNLPILLLPILISSSSCTKDDDDDEEDAPTFTMTGQLAADTGLTLEGEDNGDGGGGEEKVQAGTPTSFKVTLYRLFISPNTDCTDPVLVGDHGADGEQFDIFDEPTLFTGSPADGSYECLIIESQDVNVLKPDAEAVEKHAGCKSVDTEYEIDVFREGTPNFIDFEGEAIVATGSAKEPSIDKIVAFFSTKPADVLGRTTDTPHEYQVGQLTNALTVPGSTKYSIALTDRLTNMSENEIDYCWAEQTPISFE